MLIQLNNNEQYLKSYFQFFTYLKNRVNKKTIKNISYFEHKIIKNLHCKFMIPKAYSKPYLFVCFHQEAKVYLQPAVSPFTCTYKHLKPQKKHRTQHVAPWVPPILLK